MSRVNQYKLATIRTVRTSASQTLGQNIGSMHWPAIPARIGQWPPKPSCRVTKAFLVYSHTSTNRLIAQLVQQGFDSLDSSSAREQLAEKILQVKNAGSAQNSTDQGNQEYACISDLNDRDVKDVKG